MARFSRQKRIIFFQLEGVEPVKILNRATVKQHAHFKDFMVFIGIHQRDAEDSNFIRKINVGLGKLGISRKLQRNPAVRTFVQYGIFAFLSNLSRKS